MTKKDSMKKLKRLLDKLNIDLPPTTPESIERTKKILDTVKAKHEVEEIFERSSHHASDDNLRD